MIIIPLSLRSSTVKIFPIQHTKRKKASLDGTHVFWNALPLKVFFPHPYEKHFNSSWLENITFQRNSSHFVFFFFQISLIAYLYLNIYPTVLFCWLSVPFGMSQNMALSSLKSQWDNVNFFSNYPFHYLKG